MQTKYLLPQDDPNTSVLIHTARATGGKSQVVSGRTPVVLSKLCAQPCKYLPVLLKNINRIITCTRATCFYVEQAVLVMQCTCDKGYE